MTISRVLDMGVTLELNAKVTDLLGPGDSAKIMDSAYPVPEQP